jgi:intracellular septation protein
MKPLFDLFPVILFFVAYSLTNDIYVATAVIIPAALAQLIYVWVRHRRLDKMLLFSTVLVLVMGGLTLYLHDKSFIMWKPTVLYWFFAVLLSASLVFAKKNLIRSLLEKEIRAPDHVWNVLNWTWVAFCIALGAANLYIAYNFSERLWVMFKVWGTPGVILVFVVIQALFLARFAEEKKSSEAPRADAS